MEHPKPKYRIGQAVVGRVRFDAGQKFANKIVMMEVESAHYETNYGHWHYFGQVEDEQVEIIEFEIERSFKI